VNVIEVSGLTHRYGSVTALREVALTVPPGAAYALLGPNGAGKTTLLEILMGLQRPHSGEARVLGRDATKLGTEDRTGIGFMPEGQGLPGWMTLRQLEAFLAPLYPGWDQGLARELRNRFRLDQDRKLKTLSRGEKAKACLLCALAPRPRLLVLDEPFAGMDVNVKDELVHGLLETAGSGDWSAIISSHDLLELEALADWVGILNGGTMRVSEPADRLLGRYHRVEVVTDGTPARELLGRGTDWIAPQAAGLRLSFLLSRPEAGAAEGGVRQFLPQARSVQVTPATLREIFVAFTKPADGSPGTEEVAP
jgi:ABC-2 type transport system ATP-binding protein